MMGELRFSPEEYRSLVDSAPDATIVVDGEGRILLTNQRTTDLFGYSRDEMIGHPIEILIPERFHGTHRHSRASYRDQPHARPMGSGLELFGGARTAASSPSRSASARSPAAIVRSSPAPSATSATAAASRRSCASPMRAPRAPTGPRASSSPPRATTCASRCRPCACSTVRSRRRSRRPICARSSPTRPRRSARWRTC
jgi:hypothetical protein